MVSADMCEHEWPGSGCPQCREKYGWERLGRFQAEWPPQNESFELCEELFDGEEDYEWDSQEERGRRFLEEALELAQAVRVDREMAHKLVDRVYGRPIGEIRQEIGQVMTTLTCLASVTETDVKLALHIEMRRIRETPGLMDRIRAKRVTKGLEGISG